MRLTFNLPSNVLDAGYMRIKDPETHKITIVPVVARDGDLCTIEVPDDHPFCKAAASGSMDNVSLGFEVRGPIR
jgi:hypothetical protein